MATRRVEKTGELLREIISNTLLHELRDPRIKCMVTVTRVQPAPDLRSANVYVSLLGKDKDYDLTMKTLNACSGFVQEAIKGETELRFIPKLKFFRDEEMEKRARFETLLKQAKGSSAATAQEENAEGNFADDEAAAEEPGNMGDDGELDDEDEEFDDEDEAFDDEEEDEDDEDDEKEGEEDR